MSRYKYSEEANTKVLEIKNHQEAVRALLFAPDGQSTRNSSGLIGLIILLTVVVDWCATALYTASADKSIRAFDTLGNPTWAEMRAHE